MQSNEYQQNALRTVNKNLTDEPDLTEGLVFAGMEINAEAGEFANLVYKWVWQEHDLDKRKLALELGDILWGIAVAAHYLGYTLEDIQDLNVAKLQARYNKGHFDPADSIARVDVEQLEVVLDARSVGAALCNTDAAD